MTRPISVAELLAKNGTIGSPPVGGRRRRRRGNSDAVTVAELTGEIPVVRTGEIPVAAEEAEAAEDDVADEAREPAREHVREQATAPAEERVDAVAPEPAAIRPRRSAPVRDNGRSTAEPASRPAPRPGPPERAPTPLPRRGRAVSPERSHYPRPVRKDAPPRERSSGAESMSPDPIDVGDADLEVDLTADTAADELGIGAASYLRSTGGALFGGETVADDIARRGALIEAADEADGSDLDAELGHEPDLDADAAAEADADDDLDDADGYHEELSTAQKVMHGASIALQCIVAVIFGGGLFIAFDQLWKWNSIAALVLGVLVILGLVVAVRIVRKTEDIGSTLTAVAVGALVTFGPLALLQAN